MALILKPLILEENLVVSCPLNRLKLIIVVVKHEDYVDCAILLPVVKRGGPVRLGLLIVVLGVDEVAVQTLGVLHV